MTGMDSKAERRLAAATAQTRDYLATADWSHVMFLASSSHRPTVEDGAESGMVRVALTSRGSGITVTMFRDQARELLYGLGVVLGGEDGAA